jgi:hypothetical protein
MRGPGGAKIEVCRQQHSANIPYEIPRLQSIRLGTWAWENVNFELGTEEINLRGGCSCVISLIRPPAEDSSETEDISRTIPCGCILVRHNLAACIWHHRAGIGCVEILTGEPGAAVINPNPTLNLP